MTTFEDKIKESYMTFKSNEKNIWLERMVYKKGKRMFTSASIDRFIKFRNPFESYKDALSVKSFCTLINNISDKYVLWIKEQDGADAYNETDFCNMQNMFKGFMGEYFCYFYGENVTRFITTKGIYGVRYMSPNYGTDTGIDFFGLMNGVASVMQVKWWNQYSKDAVITFDIFQKLFSDGVSEEYIVGDGSSTKCLFLLWTGSESDVYKMLNVFKDRKITKKIVVIGEETWMRSCLDTDIAFWESFWKSLSEISN